MHRKPQLLPPSVARPALGFDALPGFGAATTVVTFDGPIPIGWLRVGDLLVTRDGRLQTLLDLGRVALSMERLRGNMGLWPIRIAPGALGREAPVAEMIVSPGQQLLLHGAELDLLFGQPEALVTARQLLGWDGIEYFMPEGDMVSYQLILEHHDLLLIDGCWTASLFLEARDVAGLRDGVPEWAARLGQGHLRPARSELDDWEVQLLTPPVIAPSRSQVWISQSA